MAPWRGTLWEHGNDGYRIYLKALDDPASVGLHHLELSIAHDLGFLVVASARNHRPELAWSLDRNRMPFSFGRSKQPPRLNVPTVAPSALYGSPFHPPARLLAEAMWAMPEGINDAMHQYYEEEHATRRQEPSPLTLLYRALLSAPVSRESEPQRARPQPTGRLSKRRFKLLPPGPPTQAPRRPLVKAVAAFRGAGWFASAPREWSDEQLAASLDAAWRRTEGEPLDVGGGLDECLLQLDEERTLTFDTEADVAEGEMVYRSVLAGLASRSGGALQIRQVREDWQLAPNAVVISFRLNSRRVEFTLPDDGDWIDPGIVVELNRQLPAEGPRFYFFDNGGQTAMVVRATELERRSLAAVRRIRLSNSPPRWWLAIRGASS
ncbi:MAG TPA: hypothetical protein VKY26_08150 [Actinomycetota bacterium]|nr:hypothetical protein [Actinomycetota bacterium]